MSLPIGVNVSKESIPGNANSAPVKTNLKAKFFYSTIITLPLTYLVISLVENNFIVTFINSLDI
jgi:predicted secreted protein|tara:strand:- start:333 stop:524 length:192 start_codon:yes stop_codon:yes gene_type:complete